MKGQYFSFDAIIATVIMVIAFTTLVAYWYGVQSTIDARTGGVYDDALRVADSLFSPGQPENWGNTSVPVGGIRQVGFANGFSNSLNSSKVKRLANMVGSTKTGDLNPANYTAIGNLLRVQGYYITVEPSNGSVAGAFYIGDSNFTGAREVAVANRGGTMYFGGVRTAMSVKVYVYTK
ncbi:Uncharacterised protein [uncultured archaeon]|nr:Uncharacterised protein [uncultured archaeon]